MRKNLTLLPPHDCDLPLEMRYGITNSVSPARVLARRHNAWCWCSPRTAGGRAGGRTGGRSNEPRTHGSLSSFEFHAMTDWLTTILGIHSIVSPKSTHRKRRTYSGGVPSIGPRNSRTRTGPFSRYSQPRIVVKDQKRMIHIPHCFKLVAVIYCIQLAWRK